MNNKNKKILMVVGGILAVPLVLSITIGGLMLYNGTSFKPSANKLPSKQPTKDTMPDFVGKDVKFVQAWLKDKKIDKVNYTIEYKDDEKVEKDRVISHTPSKTSVITQTTKYKFIISNGAKKDITAKDFENKTQAEIEKIAKELKLTNVKFKLEYHDTIEKGKLIKIEPEKTKYELNDEIIFVISKGKEEKKPEEQKKPTTNKEEAKYVNVKSKSGISPAELDKYLRSIGMVMGVVTDEVYSHVSKGFVVRNEAGDYAKGSTINYVRSLGKFSINADSLNGKSLDYVNNIVKDAMNKEADIIFMTKKEFHDSVAKGNVFGCTFNGKDLSCKISEGPEPKVIEVGSFSGKTLDEFLSFLQKNGLKAGNMTEEYSDIANGNIVSNKTGKFNPGDSVDYVVSLGENLKNVSDAQVAALSNCVEINNPEATKANVIAFITNNLGFVTPNVVIETNDKVAGEIIYSDLVAGQINANKVFTIKISKGPGAN